MKRDMDLVRRILLRAEELPYGALDASNITDDVHDASHVAAHFQLLEEAGLVEADLLTLERTGVHSGKVLRLTWAGHEYLDAVRSDSVWKKVKTSVGEKLGSAPFEVLKALAIKVASAQLGIDGEP